MVGLPASLDTATAGLNAGPMPAIPKTKDPEAMRKAAQDFETFFLTQVVNHMFAGIRTDGMFGGGHGEDVFRPMLFREYANAIAQQGGIGLSDSVMREMLKMQETG